MEVASGASARIGAHGRAAPGCVSRRVTQCRMEEIAAGVCFLWANVSHECGTPIVDFPGIFETVCSPLRSSAQANCRILEHPWPRHSARLNALVDGWAQPGRDANDGRRTRTCSEVAMAELLPGFWRDWGRNASPTRQLKSQCDVPGRLRFLEADERSSKEVIYNPSITRFV